ncbi:MAG: DNA starvation/stationary phase protection protein Dps [Planctomycetota bacterium]|nr:DNA starvation/stationary phase protection protein Dps [Planctomycetota bacterium]
MSTGLKEQSTNDNKTTMHTTKNDIPEKTRLKMVALLNARLADTIDLYQQTKQAHWNVKGPSFIALHELFDKIAENVEAGIDDMAERAVALGGVAHGTIQAVSNATTLKPYPTDISKGTDHVDALSSALAAYGKVIRAAIEDADEAGDADTADLFTGISRSIDKQLWFVEAHVQAKS